MYSNNRTTNCFPYKAVVLLGTKLEGDKTPYEQVMLRVKNSLLVNYALNYTP